MGIDTWKHKVHLVTMVSRFYIVLCKTINHSNLESILMIHESINNKETNEKIK